MAARMSEPGAGSGGAPSAFLAACRREPAAHRPIWIMRQAGRYLPEYRELRAKVDFEALTRTPELAAEVTLQPLRRFELDAAILFSDIMTPVQGMGVKLSFEPAPVVSEPIRTAAQIEALPALEPARDVPFVLETIRQVRASLPRPVPLIGFAGAPFTLMCYLVCGRPSKEFAAARTFLYSQPQAAERPPLAHRPSCCSSPGRGCSGCPSSRALPCRRSGARSRRFGRSECHSSIISTRAAPSWAR